MPDFQFNSFPINATPLADVSENTNADGILVVRNGAVQKVPLASFLAAVGAQPSANMVDYVPKTTEINNYPLSSDVDLHAVDIPVVTPQGLTGENAQALFEELAAKLGQTIQYDLLKSSYPVSGTNTYAIDWQDYDVLVFGVEQYGNRLDSFVMSTAWFRTTSFQKRPYSQAHTLSANSQINYQIYQSGEGSITVIHSGANPGSEYGFYLDGIKISAPSEGGGGGGSATWGTIGGTLSNQTDLQSALNAKISAPSSPTIGQFLSWNGSAWVAASLPVYNGGVS